MHEYILLGQLLSTLRVDILDLNELLRNNMPDEERQDLARIVLAYENEAALIEKRMFEISTQWGN